MCHDGKAPVGGPLRAGGFPLQRGPARLSSRVKQTHPDSGGDAGEFATVVRASEDVRQALPRQHHRTPVRPTPYDGWLRPCRPTPSWTEDVPPVPVTAPGSAGSGVTLTMPSAGSDFRDVLLGEMSKVIALP